MSALATRNMNKIQYQVIIEELITEVADLKETVKEMRIDIDRLRNVHREKPGVKLGRSKSKIKRKERSKEDKKINLQKSDMEIINKIATGH